MNALSALSYKQTFLCVKNKQKQIRVKLFILHNRTSWCELLLMLKHPCFATWIGSLSSGGLDKTGWIKYSWALLNWGFAVWDGPRASAECKAPARKESHIWSKTMNLTEEKPALIKEDQRQDLKSLRGHALFSFISSSFIEKLFIIKRVFLLSYQIGL